MTHLWRQLPSFQRIFTLAYGTTATVETLHHVHFAIFTLAHLQPQSVLAIVANALKGLKANKLSSHSIQSYPQPTHLPTIVAGAYGILLGWAGRSKHVCGLQIGALKASAQLVQAIQLGEEVRMPFLGAQLQSADGTEIGYGATSSCRLQAADQAHAARHRTQSSQTGQRCMMMGQRMWVCMHHMVVRGRWQLPTASAHMMPVMRMRMMVSRRRLMRSQMRGHGDDCAAGGRSYGRRANGRCRRRCRCRRAGRAGGRGAAGCCRGGGNRMRFAHIVQI